MAFAGESWPPEALCCYILRGKKKHQKLYPGFIAIPSNPGQIKQEDMRTLGALEMLRVYGSSLGT